MGQPSPHHIQVAVSGSHCAARMCGAQRESGLLCRISRGSHVPSSALAELEASWLCGGGEVGRATFAGCAAAGKLLRFDTLFRITC